jgi:hypothetical protein
MENEAVMAMEVVEPSSFHDLKWGPGRTMWKVLNDDLQELQQPSELSAVLTPKSVDSKPADCCLRHVPHYNECLTIIHVPPSFVQSVNISAEEKWIIPCPSLFL